MNQKKTSFSFSFSSFLSYSFSFSKILNIYINQSINHKHRDILIFFPKWNFL